MRQFRLVHVGVAAALAAATVTALGLVQTVGAADGQASVFVPIVPCRLADTRGSALEGSRHTPLTAAETVTFAVWGTNGNCTISNTATGIATNVTAVGPTADSFLTVFPADANPRPTASNLNVTSTSPPTPNQVTVALSATGSIAVYNNGGSVNVIVDIVGYYIPSSSGPAGPAGPSGPTGSTGPTGAPGPACPASGCTLVLTAWNSIPFDIGSTVDRYGCRIINQFSNAYLPIGLPLGAKITGVTVRYIDTNSDTTYYSLNMITVPGSTTASASAGLGTVDNQLSGSLVFSTPPPAVGPANVPFILAATASGGTQSFCGATVTYSF